MKRSEIKNGAELYHDSSPSWRKYVTWGEKVTVIDDGWWVLSGYSWSSDRKPKKVDRGTKGAGVLVNGERTGEFIAHPAHLRGPYAETKAEVEKVYTERREQQEQDRQKRDAAYARANAAAERAAQVGIRARATGEDLVTIGAADLQRMLDAMAAGLNAAGEA